MTASQKMHIGIVLPSVPGYSETFFRSKIVGLQKNGFQVTLFVKNRKGIREFLCPIKVHPMLAKNGFLRLLQTFGLFLRLMLIAPKPTLNLIRITKNNGYGHLQAIRAAVIASAILPEKVDWLHFGFATPAIEREYIGKAIGAKVAVSFRGFDLNQMPLTEGNLYSKFWPNVDKVHSISNYLVTKAHELGLPKQTPFTIITPAIDAQKFCPLPEKLQPNTILLVSRLHWIKGIEHVLEALANLKSKGILFSLTIAGEGDELERLLFARHQLGLTNEVSFVGRKSPDEIIERMQSHEIFVQYSHQEGFCNAALEAQSCGMLCIVSNADGLTENVLDGQTGWVVPKRNPPALSKKIQDVLGLTDAEKDKIRAQARVRVLKEFDIQKQEKAFVDFYAE
jgi:colanic acid/amylovoran biosynthesis glycosyltransferase